MVAQEEIRAGFKPRASSYLGRGQLASSSPGLPTSYPMMILQSAHALQAPVLPIPHSCTSPLHEYVLKGIYATVVWGDLSPLDVAGLGTVWLSWLSHST